MIDHTRYVSPLKGKLQNSKKSFGRHLSWDPFLISLFVPMVVYYFKDFFSHGVAVAESSKAPD